MNEKKEFKPYIPARKSNTATYNNINCNGSSSGAVVFGATMRISDYALV